MSFLQQLTQYLSQPPDSIVYHIITLLALQATLGLAWWQVRRRPEDALARRLAWASGLILLSRLLIVLALLATADLLQAAVLLPPLERAVDALTAALLLWALAPQPKTLPHLGSALLLIVSIVIAFFYVSFALAWRDMVEAGTVAGGYASIPQAAIWDIIQLVILGLGAGLVFIARESQWSLRSAILGTLFVAHALSLWFAGSLGPPNASISFWVRLGNIIAYPMLAVLAYRHNLHRLLPSTHLGRSTVEQLERSLDLSRRVAASQQTEQTLDDALTMIADLLPATFAGIALVDQDDRQHLQLGARIVDDSEPMPGSTMNRTWALKRSDWPGFELALRQRQQVELLPDGQGARQLHELAAELNLDPLGTMLVTPLVTEASENGLLLVCDSRKAGTWSEDEKSFVQAIGAFLAQMLQNTRSYQMALAGTPLEFEREKQEMLAEQATLSDQRDQARDQEAELARQVSVLQERLEAEHRKSRAASQALALTAQRQAKVGQLEEEIDALREALSEAEIALASAAAASAGLSTEWVMRTVTRYSGQLEEAQAQIGALQKRLQDGDDGRLLQEAAERAVELRSPLTALAGYADLLLDGSVGPLSSQQESLMRRMQINIAGMAQSVDRISAAARPKRFHDTDDRSVAVQDMIESAIDIVSPELQSKALRVDLNVAEDLPALQESNGEIDRLVIQALRSACLVSDENGRLVVDAVQLKGDNGAGGEATIRRFLHLAISDQSGSHSKGLYAQAISQQDSAGTEKKSALVTDLSALIAEAARLAIARGGRSWLDLTAADGSTLCMLLPLSDEAPAEPG